MIEIRSTRDLARLRRLALGAQGLLQSRPFGRGVTGTRRAIRHLGYVQIDTISVVERAHHHVLGSRVPDYAPRILNQLLRDGDIFEYWAHAAAFLPIDDYRYSLPYKQAIKGGQVHWYRSRNEKLMRELLARIRDDGPLRSRDLDTQRNRRAGWWDWKPAKRALEQLYMQGDLMVRDREGFQKTYDLTERVLPDHVNTQVPSLEEFAAHLLDQQLRSHGLVSLKGITYLRRTDGLRAAVKALLQQRLTAGSLEQLRLGDGSLFFCKAGALEQPLPRSAARIRILSPFDNSLIQRERLKALFDYDYQLECYLPADKREYGYFCLPLLYRERFLGRMDCKVHRKREHLEIKALYIEDQSLVDDALTDALVAAVSSFCAFQQARSVSLQRAHPGPIGRELRGALKAAQ